MVVITVGAAALRLAVLDNRPMHCDEAVHAIKFGQLLEREDYVYDPHEYHGPSLNFLALPIARLASARRLTEITEVHLRLLPAIFGIALVGLVWLVRDELGRAAALGAAVFTAVSPAMVFYSRYYIHEMLLVCFTFAAMVALWRCARCASRPRQVAWLVAAGVCIGMMHASKETCVIALFCMAVAAVAGPEPGHIRAIRLAVRKWIALLTAAARRVGFWRLAGAGLILLSAAAAVSALFFSSFLRNPPGVLDSYTTYFHYLGRASGEGTAGRHYYPWHYYLRVLFWWRQGSAPLWSEAWIAALALVGAGAAVAGKGLKPAQLPLTRFLAVYTVLMTVVYSAVPYKTPWCALGFLHGMILLAGVGATVLVRAAPGYAPKTVAVALLVVAATSHLAWQAYRASFVAYEDPHNPYVYAHTTSDVPRLVARIRPIAAAHPDGAAMHIQVICPQDDYWPLPWYLRGFNNVRWSADVPDGRPAPLILTQPEMEPALIEYLYEKQPPGQRHLYVPVAPENEPRDWQLRPYVPLRVYVRLDLWDAYRASRPDL